MSFPLKVVSNIALPSGNVARQITLHSGMTVILGPNGSGKTQLMRGMKGSLQQLVATKNVSFASAGRIGSLENFRSDHDGYRKGYPSYDEASYGSKNDQTRRHQNETLNGAFQTLAARPDSASRRLGGFGSPGDYATFKFPPPSRHDPASRPASQ